MGEKPEQIDSIGIKDFVRGGCYTQSVLPCYGEWLHWTETGPDESSATEFLARSMNGCQITFDR